MKEKSTRNGVKEIARRAKVSIATVDRVIHNRSGVAENTKDRINSIIAELNYQPNIFARQLASRKNIEFAMLLPGISPETSYWKAPLDGVRQAEKEISPLGITVTGYFFNQDDPGSFTKMARIIIDKRPAGVLLAPVFVPESVDFLSLCRDAGIPYVFIDADIPGQERLSYIGPDLFQSGCLAAHLIHYAIPPLAKVLIMNISKDLDLVNPAGSQHRLFRKEAGIRFYFTENRLGNTLVTINLGESNEVSIADCLQNTLITDPDIQGICVTNSRVSIVAKCLEKARYRPLFLLGFDFTETNVQYLKKGIIDFLICDKPREQGYRGMMALYQHVVLGITVDPIKYMPIDIVTRENCAFYRN